MGIFTNFLEYFGTFTAFAAGVVLLTQVINDVFHVENKKVKKIISWATAIVLAVVGFVCQLGFFVDYGTVDMWQGWVMTAVTGLGAGVYANGIYGIEPIKEFVHWVFKFLEQWKKDGTEPEAKE